MAMERAVSGRPSDARCRDATEDSPDPSGVGYSGRGQKAKRRGHPGVGGRADRRVVTALRGGSWRAAQGKVTKPAVRTQFTAAGAEAPG